MIRKYILSAFFIFTSVFYTLPQLSERVYYTDPFIVPEEEGELRITIDNLSFFRNNEFDGFFTEGYTLPGFWIRPTVSYQPKKNIKLEAGLHALRFWGARKYPNFAYSDLAEWKAGHYQRGFHLLPFFRAQIALSPQVNLILGSLYGGANHGLIEPLYHPELNLNADPEMGFQLLYESTYVKLDTWVNWESFIFMDDDHQEVFSVGVSSRVNFNKAGSLFHFYMPVQGILQHRGGEINTVKENTVQTLMNGAVGVGAQWNPEWKVLKRMDLEGALAGYYQQMGELLPFDAGTGTYIRSSAQLGNFKLKASYWECNDFVSLFGNPFYGSISVCYKGLTFDKPKIVYAGAEYSCSFGKGYSMGIDFDVYHYLPLSIQNSPQITEGRATTSFAFGIYFRLTPSFLLKKF